jgi:hypothetical protein
MNTAVSAKNVNCVETFENHEVKVLIYLTFGPHHVIAALFLQKI